MPWARLLALVVPERRVLTVGAIFLLIGGAARLGYPKLVGALVDATLIGSAEAANRVAIWMGLLFVIQAVAVALRYYLFAIAGERIVTRLRDDVFSSILEQETAFFDARNTGELTSRLTADASVVQNTLSVSLAATVTNLVMLVGGLALVVASSPRLTGLMVALVPPVAIGAVGVGRRLSKLAQRAQDALASANQTAEESIAGIRTVRSFAREEAEAERYSTRVWEVFRISRDRIWVVALFVAVMNMAAFGAVLAVMWFGIHTVMAGELTVGELATFILYTLVVALSLSNLTNQWSEFARARGASQRVFELIDRIPQVDRGGGEILEVFTGRVEYDGVGFAYPVRPEIKVLEAVDLYLEPGRLVALVGPSGAGKSTVSALLLRLYDPDVGTIRLDGRDLRSLDASWLRRNIGTVAQEPVLFSTTVAANIRYGRPTATDEEVRAAAQAANAHDFIRQLPGGYETEVGERGAQLSGGQKQRVAIARALLKDPPILILDEATSSLDAESEALVQEALDRLMAHRTNLVIAHRLSTVRNADQVVVLDGGRVIETGTHDELTRSDGLYRRLVSKQLMEGDRSLSEG